MHGQWIGKFETPHMAGNIVIDIEPVGDKTGGHATLYPDAEIAAPPIVGYIAPFELEASPCNIVIRTNPIDRRNGTLVPWEHYSTVFPQQPIAKIVQASVGWENSEMMITWHSDLHVQGAATLKKDDMNLPSEIQSTSMDWHQFKDHASSLDNRRYVFRGQQEPWRLQSKFHRKGRYDLFRYTEKDMVTLYQSLSAHTRHVFDRTKNDENGALLHLAQHHGFPTPLIDWSYSPFVAAYFAFHKITKAEAAAANDAQRVRIFQFDATAWREEFSQFQSTAPAPLHFSILEFVAVENTRLIPQQALSGLTNIMDVERHIQAKEREAGNQYLTAFDIPINSRQMVMKELAMMGVTAGSLFPGLDGICEELSERLFPR